MSPEELTDLAAGVSAAGVKSPATAALLDGVAATVTMQLANRHSRGGSGLYTPQHLLGLLQAFAEAQYTDGGVCFCPSVQFWGAMRMPTSVRQPRCRSCWPY